jgi:3'(2'), 5'-bisphosphate nucleotidase
VKITEELLEALKTIAAAAGREIMAVYGTEFVAEAKIDQSPLTEADLRADAVIRKGLSSAFPGVFIMSEESCSEPAHLSRFESFFLVDPLDGTKEFIKRNDEFTVNIALIEHGRPTAGVVYAPALNLMYSAGTGLGAWKESDEGRQALQVSRWCGKQPLRIIGSRSHPCEKLTAWLGTLSCEFDFVAAGSSLKFCRIAEGAAHIYPRFQPTSQWDTAAAQCVLEFAGGAVCSLEGAALTYGLDRPILNPPFIASSPTQRTFGTAKLQTPTGCR